MPVPEPPRTSQPGTLHLPLSLWLSPQIPAPRAAALRESVQQQPRFARLVDSEVGALCVLPDFRTEEVSELERRRCRVVGLPFAERFIQDPNALGQVHALPLYDFVIRPSRGAICCSGIAPDLRRRCAALTRWMGPKFSEDFGPEVGLLVTSRVSLLPESKYQAALQRRLPIVRPSYLEACWEAKAEVDMEPHLVPALGGLRICMGGLEGLERHQLEAHAKAHGAVFDVLDRAEVVIVKDVFSTLYEHAQKMGILAAPPAWLEKCLELGCCVQAVGELEVRNPKSLSLRLVGGAQPVKASTTGMAEGAAAAEKGALVPRDASPTKAGQEVGEPESGLWLSDCVVCLLYLATPALRESAKAQAWRCGAKTTLNPFDRAITHVVFRPGPLDPPVTNVSVAIEEDRVCFLDLSWLEACAQEGRHIKESAYSTHRVCFDPGCDAAYQMQVKGTPSLSAAPPQPMRALPRTASRALSCPSSENGEWTTPLPLPAAPSGAEASGGSAACGSGAAPRQPTTRVPPSVDSGVFAGQVLGLFGWASEDAATQTLQKKICGQGGTVVCGSDEAVLEAQPTICIARSFGKPALPAGQSSSPAFATTLWVDACISDGVCHARTSFPHFEPGPGPLPLPAFAGCCVRITALGASADSRRKRQRLQELAEALGATVAGQSTKWAAISHIVCVMPEHLDRKMYEMACKKNIPVVNVQWLMDCFSMHARQPEAQYNVAQALGRMDTQQLTGQEASPPSAQTFSAGILSGHDVLISPSALGCDPKLPMMAEELGGSVRAWRSVQDLTSLLEGHEVLSPPTSSGARPSGRSTLVLIEKDEVGKDDSPLATCIARVPVEHRGIFVVPTWLTETFQQRRRLPLDAFSALPAPTLPEEATLKRRRTEPSEAEYAWEPAAVKSLHQLADDSRARAQDEKAQQKVSEGLRLLELRQEPSRAGA